MRNFVVSSRGATLAALARLLLCLGAAAVALTAQSFYGEIRGIIKDPNGAGVANANVSLTNQSQGTVRRISTSRTGEYVFGDVVPATYSISVEATGFKKSQKGDVTVSTQQRVALDLTLELGQLSQ